MSKKSSLLPELTVNESLVKYETAGTVINGKLNNNSDS